MIIPPFEPLVKLYLEYCMDFGSANTVTKRRYRKAAIRIREWEQHSGKGRKYYRLFSLMLLFNIEKNRWPKEFYWIAVNH